jgi:hypothetical protein
MNRFEFVAALSGILLMIALLWVWAPRPRRSILAYRVPRRRPAKGMTEAYRVLGEVIGEATERMVYGTSVAEWKRRCDASLRASRCRRGIE